MAATLQSAVPASASDISSHLSALLTATGMAPLDNAGWIRVTGSDRVRWLNGMVTNFVQQLAQGEGCYNFVLNAQGRILADLTAFAEPDAFLLETDREQLPALTAHLDHFIIMDDVELADITAERSGILLAGPQAASILQTLGISTDNSTGLQRQCATWNGSPIEIIHAWSPLVPRFEIWADAATAVQLAQAIAAAGATGVSEEALDQLRILEGTPRYGTDIRNTESARDLPQETDQTRALHFAKGCYLGQEIVERIRSRGNVHRILHGFELTGAVPKTGTELTAETFPRPIGELTSVTAIQLPASAGTPARQVQLALGYVRREALDRNLTLEYPGGIAKPIPLPYPIS